MFFFWSKTFSVFKFFIFNILKIKFGSAVNILVRNLMLSISYCVLVSDVSIFQRRLHFLVQYNEVVEKVSVQDGACAKNAA
jgi:hypothetical protein